MHHCVLKECFQKGTCTVCVTAVRVSMETLKNVVARNVPPTARLVSMEKRTTCVQVVTLNFFSKTKRAFEVVAMTDLIRVLLRPRSNWSAEAALSRALC